MRPVSMSLCCDRGYGDRRFDTQHDLRQHYPQQQHYLQYHHRFLQQHYLGKSPSYAPGSVFVNFANYTNTFIRFLIVCRRVEHLQSTLPITFSLYATAQSLIDRIRRKDCMRFLRLQHAQHDAITLFFRCIVQKSVHVKLSQIYVKKIVTWPVILTK